jgi:4'-phosphopantetheinyl transferase
MAAPGWLSRSLADVPDGDRWLGPRERAVLAGLRLEHRREQWRLGRWTAKVAVGAWLGAPPEDVQVVAAADGAPEAWRAGRRAPLSISLSHRGGRAIAAVAGAGAVGCDLELEEPRSAAFVREWLSEPERAAVAAAGPVDGPSRVANLLWTAKEAAAKVRRGGLRLDVRAAAVHLDPPGAGGGDAGGWAPLRVEWPETAAGGVTCGWWRAEPGWLVTVAAEPAPGAPVHLDERGDRPR